MPDGKPLLDQAHGRGRSAAGDDPRRHDDRPAMAAVRHRRHDRRRRRRTFLTRRNGGDFEAIIGWSVETWGGHPDLSLLPRQLALAVRRRPGKTQPPRNWQRWSNPGARQDHRADPRVAFDDPKGIELGQEFVKLTVREMPIIPLMSYNVFTVMDETYWTGYPDRRETPTPTRCRTGELPLHDGEAEAGRSTSRATRRRPRLARPPLRHRCRRTAGIHARLSASIC